MTKRLAASNHDNNAIPTPGKYGILRVSDYHSKQRTFTVWLDEVESVMSFTGPKWELQIYFSFWRCNFAIFRMVGWRNLSCD